MKDTTDKNNQEKEINRKDALKKQIDQNYS
jgi:hypothetical protein